MQMTNGDYGRKIKTREELFELLGRRPRPKTVVMCHGAFDLVHPGHIRHLTYAKSKADILVASLTSDAHIEKAHYRPFVPQELRAMNLAALEAVDYVLIDEQPTPLDNIEYLQPDYFAKGYEYTDGGVHAKTREEMDLLEAYGGEVLFTPGDVVFSSSRFIEEAPPNISYEKLITLLDTEGIGFDSLREGLSACKGLNAHVVGDAIVDSYVYCTPIGSSTSKTPTLSVSHNEQIDFAGGAAVVARHLRAAGANVTFSTVLGTDDAATFVRSEMASAGIDLQAIDDPSRPTTKKATYIAGSHRLLKVDKVDNRPISERIREQLSEALAASTSADVVVFSDFRHGIFGRETIPDLTASIPEGTFRVADSQVASRWGNILDFQSFDLITPNEKEARFALADQDSVVRPLALELYRRADCRLLILKLGPRGIITYREPTGDVRAFFTIDSFADPVVDPVGAGDALLAYSTLALRATQSSVVGSVLGIMAAGIACQHEGNTPVTPEEVLAKLELVEQHVSYA